MKLAPSTRAALAHRAKERRKALKLSCRELAEITGISTANLVQCEKVLPQKATHDAKWEAALKVPPGWLRNPDLPSPELVVPTFDVGRAEQETISHFIMAYCAWHARPRHNVRTVSYAELSPREQRIADLMARRYGSDSEESSTLQAIADDLGLTRERVRQIEEKAAAQFSRVSPPMELVKRLYVAFAGHLPCRLSELPNDVRKILGRQQSLEGADRFFREVLSKRLINLRTLGGMQPATPEKIVVADDAPDEDTVRAVRQVSLGMVRQAGAAQIFFVAGALSAQSVVATPSQVVQCARMFAGFEWLIEDEGWFWFGPATDNRAKWTALKVLSAANRPVDIEELYGAMARARFSKSNDRVSPAAVSAPMPVLQIVIGKIPEIRRSHFNDFRIASEISDDAPATFLSPTELLIYETIRRHGGVVSRLTLTQELAETGQLEKITMDMALVSSPVFRRLDRGIWTITGFSFSYEALQKAHEAKRHLQLSNGWYELEVTLPRTAFERGDWLVPAASQPYLTSGDYQILGIEGTARYVENLVGGPYLKRFGHLVASAGFEVSQPYLFGISADERVLRFEPLPDEDGTELAHP
jgi:transcriptional regulator with XRE-family HTH domain